MQFLFGDDYKTGGKEPRKSRREAREAALMVVYAYEMSRNNIHTILDELCVNFAEVTDKFVRSLAIQSIQHSEAIDKIIESRAKNWEFDRIAIIDRILMRMAICEILYFDDIPPKVSINEMIEIGKRYSTEKSSRFINGILDTIYEELKKEGRVNKLGRGLLE